MSTENNIAAQMHQKTIDLQAGIISSQQKAIDVANVRIGDLVEANANLEKTIQWYRNMRTEGMVTAARADIAAAAPSEQVAPPVNPQHQGTEAQRNAVYMALHYYMKIAQPDEWAGTDAAIAAFIKAAPAAPLPELTGPSEANSALIEALTSIKEMTDADDPESYRCDDREGCFDAVFSEASRALAASPSPAPAPKPDTEALEMLARVLKYIDPHAVDVALARTGPMEDAYINTIARKCVERCMAKVKPAAPGASTEGTQ